MSVFYLLKKFPGGNTSPSSLYTTVFIYVMQGEPFVEDYIATIGIDFVSQSLGTNFAKLDTSFSMMTFFLSQRIKTVKLDDDNIKLQLVSSYYLVLSIMLNINSIIINMTCSGTALVRRDSEVSLMPTIEESVGSLFSMMSQVRYTIIICLQYYLRMVCACVNVSLHIILYITEVDSKSTIISPYTCRNHFRT